MISKSRIEIKLKIIDKQNKPLILKLRPAIIPLAVELIIGIPTICKYDLVNRSPAYFTRPMSGRGGSKTSDIFLLINSDAVHGGEEKGVLVPFFDPEAADWSFEGVGVPHESPIARDSSTTSEQSLVSQNVGPTRPLPREVDERNRRIALQAAIERLGVKPPDTWSVVAPASVRDRVRQAEVSLGDIFRGEQTECCYMLHQHEISDLQTRIEHAHPTKKARNCEQLHLEGLTVPKSFFFSEAERVPELELKESYPEDLLVQDSLMVTEYVSDSVTIAGTISLQELLRTLCHQYDDIFGTVIRELPIRVPPYKMGRGNQMGKGNSWTSASAVFRKARRNTPSG
jgi:hypothetical protein